VLLIDTFIKANDIKCVPINLIATSRVAPL
jgi:hypothetical protein